MVSVISGAWAKMISKNVSKHEITVSLSCEIEYDEGYCFQGSRG